jgi:RNA polymerase sigma factor (sigma-70 family)
MSTEATQIDASDHLLLSRYSRSRDPETFLELVRRHTGLVYGTCLRITENVHDAEELTQECFLDLARQASEIRTSLVGWLHQAATHRALNRLRGERRRRVHEQRAGIERVGMTVPAVGTASDKPWSEIAPIVDRALAELPERLRTPILMRYLEGASQAEVANSLGVHQSTISRRLEEGIESLRAILGTSGLIIPAAVLIGSLTAQSAVAAPQSLTYSIGKVALAGVGTSLAANGGGSGVLAWAMGAAKNALAFLFVPVMAGILWGQIVFLLVTAAWCAYLGLHRPEWVRVLCFTRQYPNIYEWPFFPFTRWTWEAPPREWRIWMAGYLVAGVELLGLIAIPLTQLRNFWLVLSAAAFWHIFMGLRIWRRVRLCRSQFPANSTLAEWPIDGALLLTYTVAGVVLIAKLTASPWLFSRADNQAESHWPQIIYAMLCGTALIWGGILVFSRFRHWRQQGAIDPVITREVDDLAPPRWLLVALMAVPLAFVFLITFVTLTHDVLPVYVPFGENPITVARRTMFILTLSAMDFIVLVSLPLAYLYRRIPKTVWGVAFGVVGLIGVLNLGLFTKTIIAAPVLKAPPRYEQPPRMTLSQGHFVLESPPNLLENASMVSRSEYLGNNLVLSVRFAHEATVSVAYDGHVARLSIPKNNSVPESEIVATVFVVPDDFHRGIPSRIKISLIVVDARGKTQSLRQHDVPVGAKITPAEWKSQFEFSARKREEEHLLGETIALGTVRGKPVTLQVISDTTRERPRQ